MGTEKKEPAIKKNGRLPTKRAKWNGGKQTIRYRIENNGYKDAQGTHRQLQRTEWELQQMEKEIETINKNQEEMIINEHIWK